MEDVTSPKSMLWCVYCQLVPGDSTNIHVADKVVKVPEMAESISEGTLKQWSKRSSTLVHLWTLLETC